MQNITNIPNFPNFKKLEIYSKKDFEAFTSKYLPYSDFNFTSIFSYNTDEEITFSKLNENLVVHFTPYEEGEESFFTFIGTNRVEDTIKTLLGYCEKLGKEAVLKLIPEVVIEQLGSNSPFEIIEDADNHDYIISVDETASLSSSKLHKHRNMVKKFNLLYPNIRVEELDLSNEGVKKDILKLFDHWTNEKQKEDAMHEKTALTRLLLNLSGLDVFSLGAYNQNELVGFVIAEILSEEFAIFHFAKSHVKYKGMYVFLYHLVAKHLQQKGVKKINLEQDLGLSGLRFAKQQWNPINFLKKYTVKPK